MFLGSVGWTVCHFKLCADSASFDIVSDTDINSGPVDGHSCQNLDFLNSFVAVMQVTKGPLSKFWRDTYSVSFKQCTIFNCELVSGTPEVMEIQDTSPTLSGQLCRVNW